MIKRYKTVSIVYGGSGSKYASSFCDMVLSFSQNNKIAIRPVIILENILTGELLNKVIALFKESDACVVFLTVDDIFGDKKRIRQNVLFELGMALFNLGRERCVVLSDFNPQSETVDLPSDIKSIEIREFSHDNQKEIFESLIKKIFVLTMQNESDSGQINELPSYKDLLTRDVYYIDYENLFNYPEKDIDLSKVLNDWYEECKSFSRYEERAIYFLERVGFLPIFGKKDGIYDWYKKIEVLLSSYSINDINESSLSLLKFTRNLLFGVINYVCYSFDKNQKEYRIYAEMIAAFEDEEVPKNVTLNPLLVTAYYDYLGLAYMHSYELTKDIEHLNKAINHFELVVNECLDKIDTSLRVWSGFLFFNLARAYRKKYFFTNNKEDMDLSSKYYKKACLIRKGWIVKTWFSNTIRNALSVEYFIAAMENIEFREEIMEIQPKDSLVEFELLHQELENYYSDDEKLEKLSMIQKQINLKISDGSKINVNY